MLNICILFISRKDIMLRMSIRFLFSAYKLSEKMLAEHRVIYESFNTELTEHYAISNSKNEILDKTHFESVLFKLIIDF